MKNNSFLPVIPHPETPPTTAGTISLDQTLPSTLKKNTLSLKQVLFSPPPDEDITPPHAKRRWSRGMRFAQSVRGFKSSAAPGDTTQANTSAADQQGLRSYRRVIYPRKKPSSRSGDQSLPSTAVRITAAPPLPVQGGVTMTPLDFLRRALSDGSSGGLTIVASERLALLSHHSQRYFENAFWWLYLKYVEPHDTPAVFEQFIADEAAKRDQNKNIFRLPGSRLRLSSNIHHTHSTSALNFPHEPHRHQHHPIPTMPKHLIPSAPPRRVHAAPKKQQDSKMITSSEEQTASKAFITEAPSAQPFSPLQPSPPSSKTSVPRNPFFDVAMDSAVNINPDWKEQDVAIFESSVTQHFFLLFRATVARGHHQALIHFAEIMANGLFRALRFAFPYHKDVLNHALYVHIFEEISFLTSGVERSKGYVMPQGKQDFSFNGGGRRRSSQRMSLMDHFASESSDPRAPRASVFRSMTAEGLHFKRQLEDVLRHGALGTARRTSSTMATSTEAVNGGDDRDVADHLTSSSEHVRDIVRDLQASLASTKTPRHWYEEGRHADKISACPMREVKRGLFDVTKSSPIVSKGMSSWDIDTPPMFESRGRYIKWTV